MEVSKLLMPVTEQDEVSKLLMPVIEQDVENNVTLVTVRIVTTKSVAYFIENNCRTVKAKQHELKNYVPCIDGLYITPRSKCDDLPKDLFLLECVLKVKGVVKIIDDMRDAIDLADHVLNVYQAICSIPVFIDGLGKHYQAFANPTVQEYETTQN